MSAQGKNFTPEPSLVEYILQSTESLYLEINRSSEFSESNSELPHFMHKRVIVVKITNQNSSNHTSRVWSFASGKYMTVETSSLCKPIFQRLHDEIAHSSEVRKNLRFLEQSFKLPSSSDILMMWPQSAKGTLILFHGDCGTARHTRSSNLQRQFIVLS